MYGLGGNTRYQLRLTQRRNQKDQAGKQNLRFSVYSGALLEKPGSRRLLVNFCFEVAKIIQQASDLLFFVGKCLQVPKPLLLRSFNKTADAALGRKILVQSAP
jgi:hypothetical protein